MLFCCYPRVGGVIVMIVSGGAGATLDVGMEPIVMPGLGARVQGKSVGKGKSAGRAIVRIGFRATVKAIEGVPAHVRHRIGVWCVERKDRGST